MSNLKIVLVNDHPPTYATPFDHLGMEISTDFENCDLDEVGLLVFTGGSDVSPSVYGEKAHPSTFANPRRDAVEVPLAKEAIAQGIPIAGICRGSQLMCALAGGRLVQDISGHGRPHPVIARYPGGEVEEISVSSSHHQMQYPFVLPEDDYDVLAWSKEPLSYYYRFGDEEILRHQAKSQLKMEPDVVWYPKIKALAAQYHPEWMERNSDGFKYFQLLVDHYLVPLIEERNGPIVDGKETNTAIG